MVKILKEKGVKIFLGAKIIKVEGESLIVSSEKGVDEIESKIL
ncbi:MAG: hypothetical protein RMJ39_10140 [Deltaproteobacteria bacterium]|nr:hypothetical protein [Deltaproteobacteria bacterium]